MQDANGNFLSGWKLSEDQTRHLLETGNLWRRQLKWLTHIRARYISIDFILSYRKK